jgi:hypothetical protein
MPWLTDDGEPMKGALRLRQPEADALMTITIMPNGKGRPPG